MVKLIIHEEGASIAPKISNNLHTNEAFIYAFFWRGVQLLLWPKMELPIILTMLKYFEKSL